MDSQGKLKVNLCCGPVLLDGYVNIDIAGDVDIRLDLEKELLPFPDGSVDVLVCISAINYFTRQRAIEILRDVHRVLGPGGVARFGVQDLRLLAARYLERDEAFWFQKLPNGSDRFPGRTFAEKFNAFFYGFPGGGGNTCKYVYDFETLRLVFAEAGFSVIDEKAFRQSRIPDIERIDNRPEQMFFLEAVKEPCGESVRPGSCGGASGRDRLLHRAATLEALASGDRSRAWQMLLKGLDLNPADKSLTPHAVDMALEVELPDHARRIVEDFLAAAPGEAEHAAGLAARLDAYHRREGGRPGPSRIPQEYLDRYDARQRAPGADADHLAESMAWLRRSQEATRDGGSSAMYLMGEQRWEVSYPETTGYIIATCLAYWRLTGDGSWLDAARTMAAWETSIQAPDGGAGEPVGVYTKRPRIFNTGQVMLGWLALARATGDVASLDSARRAGDWIVGLQDGDGKWSRYTYRGPRAYKSRVAWALLELHGVTGEERYRQAALRFMRWTLGQARPNGWFDATSLTAPDRPWTHLIGYTLVGLLEMVRLEGSGGEMDRVLQLVHAAGRNIASFHLADRTRPRRKYLGLPGTFDPDWRSDDDWSCLTGNAQIEFFLRRLARFVPDPCLIEAADSLLDELKRVHLVEGVLDRNVRGGLGGSHPMGGGYCPYTIPNWGVKFFADSLLQRLLPPEDQYCLG